MLSIVSVKFGSKLWLEQNLELIRRLNPNSNYDFFVVNNDSDLNFKPSPEIQVLPAVPRVLHGDKGSYHHAAALNSALPLIKTRFLLILDPDFYVIQPNWIEVVIDYMKSQSLACFGSIWHPRWTYQYRYFPSVHFMLFDLEKIPLETLDFTPDIGVSWWDRTLARSQIPASLKTILQIGTFRDTGSRVQRLYQKAKIEYLQPHFDLESATSSFDALQKLSLSLPDRFSLIPKRKNYFTAQSFLRQTSLYAYQQQWEEFFWQNAPFAFHLRQVGRGSGLQDQTELSRLLQNHDTKAVDSRA
jgi:Glycosyl transferase family 2